MLWYGRGILPYSFGVTLPKVSSSVCASNCVALVELADRLCLPRLVTLVEEAVIKKLEANFEMGEDNTEDALKIMQPCQVKCSSGNYGPVLNGYKNNLYFSSIMLTNWRIGVLPTYPKTTITSVGNFRKFWEPSTRKIRQLWTCIAGHQSGNYQTIKTVSLFNLMVFTNPSLGIWKSLTTTRSSCRKESVKRDPKIWRELAATRVNL